jgi:hypothetical protein
MAASHHKQLLKTFCFSFVVKAKFVSPIWVTRKLMGENLRVVWAKFSTLILPVLQNVYNPWPVQTRLDLKTQPRFCPVSLSLSMPYHNICNYSGDLSV